MGPGSGESKPFDVVIIGNGIAAAGAILELRHFFERNPRRELSVVVLEAETEDARAAYMPGYSSRGTFPSELALPGIDDTVLNWYERVAYYTHVGRVLKNLPARRLALVDIFKLIALVEKDLPPQIQLRLHKQVCGARYVGDGGNELVELSVQYPFGSEKVFEETDRIRARTVLECSGTGSLLLDKMQGYRNDSQVVCGVLAFKVIGAHLPDIHEISLGLDDSITHGAGAWSYPSEGISPALGAYLEEWFRTTTNKRVQQLIRGKRVEDFAGTISDVGISSIAPFANAQHYRANLERQVEELFQRLPGYREMFLDAAVIPGSAFFKPSPVLQPVAQMAGRRYLLAGDAAGHATPYIGEGIRPGLLMGQAAARVLLEGLEANDLSEGRLRSRYEQIWWERFGHYDIWADLFRHFSSTCFSDKEWGAFFSRLRTLTDEEFYAIVRSEYDFGIVCKMFPYELVPHYLKYRLTQARDFLTHRLTPRQVDSWLR